MASREHGSGLDRQGVVTSWDGQEAVAVVRAPPRSSRLRLSRPYALLAALWWLHALALLFVGRPIIDFLRPRGMLAHSVGAALFAAGVATALSVRHLWRRGALRPAGVAAVSLSVLMTLLVGQLLPQFEERWHVVQYAVLGALVWAGLGRRWLPALLITVALGAVDEGLQGPLPDRVYDTRDLVLNAYAGVLGVAIAELGARLGRARNVMTRRGVPIVISAPSGAGKTTICHEVMKRVSGIEFSVSHTTRAPRGAEKHGVDYWFVDDASFLKLVADGALLEHAEVHGKRYGTSRLEADKRLERGIDVLFDIDVQGGRQIKDRLPGAVLVFVLPPHLQELERRLRGRGSDSEEQVQRRMQAARDEMRDAAGLYQYFIVNHDLETAVRDLEAIVRAERLKRLDAQSVVDHIVRGAT